MIDDRIEQQPGTVEATVSARRTLSDDVVEIVLAAPDLSNVEWAPGAHIDLILPSGLVRQYSLCGGTPAAGELHIAVLDEPSGRGGSREVHQDLHPGVKVGVRGPRNHFKLVEAPEYLFIAGGIGITPILAMIAQVATTGASWSLLYGGRTRKSMAYVQELENYHASRTCLGTGEFSIVPEDELGRPDLRRALGSISSTTLVYACGPEPLLQAIEDLAAELLNPGQLHLERFGAAERAVDTTGDGGLDEFEVELAASGQVLQVGAEDRLIDIVRTVAPQVPFSCEEGYCGSCETGVMAGLPCHRDTVLTDEERAENDTMMICVGRSLTKRLTLDL